jgi:hypothetical protein
MRKVVIGMTGAVTLLLAGILGTNAEALVSRSGCPTSADGGMPKRTLFPM